MANFENGASNDAIGLNSKNLNAFVFGEQPLPGSLQEDIEKLFAQYGRKKEVAEAIAKSCIPNLFEQACSLGEGTRSKLNVLGAQVVVQNGLKNYYEQPLVAMQENYSNRLNAIMASNDENFSVAA